MKPDRRRPKHFRLYDAETDTLLVPFWRPAPGDLDRETLRLVARLDIGEALPVGGGSAPAFVIERGC